MSLKESDVLGWLQANSPTEASPIVEGVRSQDDAAVFDIKDGFEVCATTDFVRGTGFMLFKKGYLSFGDLGHYVVRANVSDLAAMGAEPLAYLSVVRYRSDRDWQDVEALLVGIREACEDLSCPLVGGDTGTYEIDVLSGTAIGQVERGSALARKKMRPEQALFVTGDIGRPAAALAISSNGKEEVLGASFEDCLQRWRRPQPRVAFARELVLRNLGASAMDISDGLAASLRQLGRINRIGFEIEEAALPISQSVRNAANSLGIEAAEIACGASVDFELLFSVPSQSISAVYEIGTDLGVSVTKIGTTTATDKLLLVKHTGEKTEHFPGIPWDHQVSDVGDLFRRP